MVSGGQLKNSRFWEIAAGDRVQSALRGRVCSATRQILRLDRRQLGMSNPGCRAELAVQLAILRFGIWQTGYAKPALSRRRGLGFEKREPEFRTAHLRLASNRVVLRSAKIPQ